MTSRRSVNSKVGKTSKPQIDQEAISQQLQEISAKLCKLDELEKLNKVLQGNLLKLSHRVDAVTAENRLLKQEIADLKQAQLQDEILIKGFKLKRPEQHREVFQNVCKATGFEAPDVKEVRPLVFKKNQHTDAVLVKFWRVEDKNRFIKCVRSIKKPLTPRDVNVRSKSKFILVQDHLTPEKLQLHNKAWDLTKLGLQRPWFYRGSTWISHSESKKPFRVGDLKDVDEIEFILCTREDNGHPDLSEFHLHSFFLN
ncbi:hypothetical protein quinque_008633 [Culex quinquefasciatus]